MDSTRPEASKRTTLPLTEAEPKENEASAPPEAAAKAEAKKEHMPRLDWAYAAAPDVRFLDVLACAGCGGTSHFPGSTAWSRLPVVELPEADELGPIPGALARLGRAGAQALALAPLLVSRDSDTRYFALLTAGNLPYPELVDGVLRGLFDDEPDLSSAARTAATALKHLPRLDGAMKELRQQLSSPDSLRRSLAARALGALHDREAVEGLIQLAGSEDAMCAQAAAEALREVTRATHGLDVRAWRAWWAENKGKRRVDWLVAALRHAEPDIRLASLEELSRVLHDTLGYYADAPAPEREAAVRRWEAAVSDPARARRFALL